MTYRVFQWASGMVGRHAARVCIEREPLELVGLHAFSPEKLGKDVGEILKRGPTGIKVTGDIETILSSDADVVLHAPIPSLIEGEDPDQDLKDICRLLAGGKNVITVVGYMCPAAHGEELVERLDSACRAGGSSFHSTGLNPGWIGDLLPLSMAALSERIDRVDVQEISSFEGYPSPEIMFDSMGFGSTEEQFQASNERRTTWLEGVPRMHLEFPREICSDWLLATAMHAVNAIPFVSEASPGICTHLDLPWISPAGCDGRVHL